MLDSNNDEIGGPDEFGKQMTSRHFGVPKMPIQSRHLSLIWVLLCHNDKDFLIWILLHSNDEEIDRLDKLANQTMSKHVGVPK